mgnify:FL=1
MMTPGSYFAVLIRWGRGESQISHSPQVWLEWEITHQATANGEWTEIQPVKRTMFWSLAGGAVPFTLERLDKMGFNGCFDDNMTFDNKYTTEGCEIVCKHEADKREAYKHAPPREKWDLPYQTTQLEDRAFEHGLSRQLAAQWSQYKRGQAQPPPPAPQGRPPAISPGKTASHWTPPSPSVESDAAAEVAGIPFEQSLGHAGETPVAPPPAAHTAQTSPAPSFVAGGDMFPAMERPSLPAAAAPPADHLPPAWTVTRDECDEAWDLLCDAQDERDGKRRYGKTRTKAYEAWIMETFSKSPDSLGENDWLVVLAGIRRRILQMEESKSA